MDYHKEAEVIRSELPEQRVLTPPPLPFVGQINLLRRHDGGYLIAAMGYDDQAGQLDDGSLAAEVIDAEGVSTVAPADLLAEALQRAHHSLKQLRLEATLLHAAELGGDQTEDQLVEQLRAAIRRRSGVTR